MVKVVLTFDDPVVMQVSWGPNITGSQIELKHTYKTKRCNFLAALINAYLLTFKIRRIRSHNFMATKWEISFQVVQMEENTGCFEVNNCSS